MQQGGSQYGVPPPPQPEMTAFGFTENGTQPQPHVLGIPDSNHFQQNQQLPVAETALLVSSRPPAAASPSNFVELVPAAGNYPDDVDALTAGEEAERGPAGNRWPREKTLALIKIRSDMDATFRDATLKGPLWEEVSRKLAEQGYTRSAKKCKEKFENVHKYYKRTKDKFGGRQDGKSYRFFAQLEALYSGSSSSAAATLPSHTTRIYQPIPLSSISPPPSVPRPAPLHPPAPMAGVSTDGLSFSSDTLSCSSSEMDREETEEGQRKRKRKSVGGSGGRNRKMMSFFEGLMQQVMERQEAMQKKFLETIEKRDQDRMIREEAWRRQEMATFNHEHQMMAHERAMSASRDASVITFLQKITGQTVQLPQPISITVVPTTQTPSPPPKQREQQSPPPPPTTTQQQKEQAPFPQPQQQRLTENSWSPTPMPSSKLFQVQEQNQGVSMSMEPASSRWPKPEVIALINLRSGLEPRYQEAGPKGPLWEEISAGMKRLGYIRSAKRCKEKWENINKYFKKVKESNKKRPEDAKTCPYFHQLDELYRKKILEGGGGGGGGYISQNKQENEPNPNIRPITILPPPPPATPPSQVVHSGNKSEDGGPSDDGTGVSNILTKTSCNGGDQTSSFEERNGGNGEIKKSRNNTEMDVDEDIDDIVDDEEENEDEDDEEDEEEQKMAYKIEFQRQNVSGNANNGANPSVATTSSSFLAMVQ